MSRNTIAHVSHAALRHNLRRVRELAPASAVVCVVKADAYGHGISRVTSALAGADVLAVTTTREGRRCRESGWRGRLLSLQGPGNAAELDEIVALGAEMVVHHAAQIELLKQKQLGQGSVLWLKIDTGMHRLGFPAKDVGAVHAELERLGPAPGVVLMSHFACADELANPMTQRQLRLFDEATHGLPRPASLANSAAILNFPESHRDYVRPGILLYGSSPCADRSAADLGLRPAMTLSCELVAINRVGAGETVGYGASYTCPRNMTIGVGAIGYGDGYSRQFRNGTPVLVNGRRAALVGRVSMDMITIDLGQHPDARVGDQVVLWGDGLPLEEVAGWADAIPYQLICGVTERVAFRVG